MGKVLVLDGDRETALSIVHSLGSRGVHVTVGATQAHALAATSRYCRNVVLYPSPLEERSAFQDVIQSHVRNAQYDLVIPVTDLTICPLMPIREYVERYACLAMAANTPLAVTQSKSATYEVASSLGVRIPKSFEVKKIDEIPGIAESIHYPAVLKPDRSKDWNAEGQGTEASVAYAFDPHGCERLLHGMVKASKVLIQEYVAGEGVGVGVLASKGKTLVAFQYKRLHEVPITGGGSSYRVSETPDETIIRQAEALIQKLQWDGVAMVEFKRDIRSRHVCLMEINGRFWGGLPLAVAAGADFPSYLYDLFVLGKKEFPRSYRVGVRCRNVKRDIEWMKAVWSAADKSSPSVVSAPSVSVMLQETARLLDPKEFWDTRPMKDPRPAIRDAWQVVTQLAASIARKLRSLYWISVMRWHQRHPAHLHQHIREARNILFVCTGNIMRSPYAEQFLLRHLPTASGKQIRSTGLLPLSGRPAHVVALEQAKQRGINLATHRSSMISKRDIEQADVIFVMEVAHLEIMMERFSKQAREKLYLLGCCAPVGPIEIRDPYDLTGAAATAVFDQLDRALGVVRHIMLPAAQDHVVS